MIESNIKEVVQSITEKFVQTKINTLQEAGIDWKQETERILKDKGIKDSGELLQSIGFSQKDEETLELFINAAYARFVDEGIRPGTYVPVYELQDWTNRKIGNDEGAVYRIQKSIYEKGIDK